MAGVTAAPWSIPYPTGTDRVADGDNAIQAVADRMNALLAQNLVGAPVPVTNVPTVGGFAGVVTYAARAGVVTLNVNPTKASWAGGDLVATVPAPYRPPMALFMCGYKLSSGNPCVMTVRPDGNIVVLTAGSEVGFNGYFTYLYGATIMALPAPDDPDEIDNTLPTTDEETDT